jgi:hypothetical protein
MTIPYQFVSHFNNEEEPNSASLEDELGPSCSSVEPDFPELTVPPLISQSELKDLVRDLSLSKFKAEHLASHLGNGICYSKALKGHTGNVSNHCQHFF